MVRIRLAALLVLVLLPSRAWSADIWDGEETSDYPAVVALGEDLGDDWVLVFCTATLIEPDLLLTAGHCLDVGSPTWAYFGDHVFGEGGFRADVESWVVHEGWDGDFQPGGAVEYDLALVQLEDDVAGVDPIPVSEQDPSELVGETVRFVGFGDSNGASEPAVKRTALSTVDEQWYDFFLTSALTGSPCVGDSGGPMLAGEGDDLRVAGVNSFVIDACGDRAGATRVVEYLDWIVDPDGWQPADDDDDALNDDDDRETVTLGEMREGRGCQASLAPGAAGSLGLLLLALLRRRATPAR